MLKVNNLSITYKATDKRVVDNLSFELKKGEVLAIMGPSGCGKTTLLKVIGGLLDNTQATIDGSIVNKHPVATVFQEPRLVPWLDVIGNINLVYKNSLLNIDEILNDVGLDGYQEYKPKKLSLGMQQRVNLLRAIFSEPDILLLDEAFSALDKVTKQKVMSFYKKIHRKYNLSTIFVTHNEEEAAFLADRIIYLGVNPRKIAGGRTR